MELQGWSTGGFGGIPKEAMGRMELLISTTDHVFKESFVAFRGRRIAPVQFTPGDFLGREAIVSGIARTRGRSSMIEGNGWKLLANAGSPWPDHMEGKLVEAHGTIAPGTQQDTFELPQGDTRLVRLEDQLGREVSLRARAWSLNGHWWIEYRGTRLHVENMTELPGFAAITHADPVLVRGTLDQADLPRIDQIALKAERDLQRAYIVRNASIEPLPGLLSPELAPLKLP